MNHAPATFQWWILDVARCNARRRVIGKWKYQIWTEATGVVVIRSTPPARIALFSVHSLVFTTTLQGSNLDGLRPFTAYGNIDAQTLFEAAGIGAARRTDAPTQLVWREGEDWCAKFSILLWVTSCSFWAPARCVIGASIIFQGTGHEVANFTCFGHRLYCGRP
jgi:hypothetical protein